MRKTIVGILLAAALACMTLPEAVQAAPAAELNFNLVDFSVQARREVGNDLMQATLFAESVGSNPAELAAIVNKRLAAAVAKAKAVQNV